MYKQHSLLCFLAVFVLICLADGSHFRFDYTYNRDAGGWLKFHQFPADFKHAFLRCKAEGAVLASPTSVELRKAMTTMYKHYTDSCGIYTGINAMFSKGDFATVDGIPLSRIPVLWAADEPDNYSGDENCTIMLQNSTLADVRCNDTRQYMCFKKKTLDLVFSSCGTVDKEYTYEERTGSCYKFHATGRIWSSAYMTCMAEGGHLAIVNSAVESQVIKEMFAKHPANKITAKSKDILAVGHHDWFEKGVWYTIHGQTLAEAGFDTFNPGQPDNNFMPDGGQDCGGIFRNGLLDDVSCLTMTYPFICEKKPESLVNDEEDH